MSQPLGAIERVAVVKKQEKAIRKPSVSIDGMCACDCVSVSFSFSFSFVLSFFSSKISMF